MFSGGYIHVFSLTHAFQFFDDVAVVETKFCTNYINPGYGLSLVDTLWNASSYRQPLEQEGNPMT